MELNDVFVTQSGGVILTQNDKPIKALYGTKKRK
jgi:hypothetical protein